MTLQSFITIALLALNTGIGAVTIHAPSRHSHLIKRTTLKNNNNGPCMTAASNSNGAHVVVGDCSSAQWTLPASGSGMIHIYGDKCLDVTDGKKVNGNKLQIWECTSGPNQKFTLTNGQIQVKGTNLCLDLTDGKTNNGNPIQLWTCDGNNKNQKWSLPTSSGSGVSTTGGGGSSSHPFGGSKILLAYPDGNLDELLNFGPAKVFYNWRTSPGGISQDELSQHGLQFLPQIWGWDYVDQFKKDTANSNAPLYLGMNECNEPGQSNMSPESGISLWKQTMKPLRDRGKKTCSPAMSGNPNGLEWMKTFSEKCGSDCEFDYVCAHWYDTTFEKFQAWLEKWRDMYPGKPVIVTEFAPQNFNGGGQPSVGDVWSFYQQAVPWALSQDWIAAIAPYGAMTHLNINQNAKLVNSNGTPNDLFKYILSHA